jgi:uncharacterized protein YqjF (DUF2071 family)
MLDAFKTAGRQARSLDRVGHRPWPAPHGRWVAAQTWEDLLFAHWPVPLDAVRYHVPHELEIELQDGSAWVGIVPFRLTGLRLRGTVPLPRLSAFLELNVRTYVRAADGKPGVWFFSLDASSPPAVIAARRLFKLPYYDARMSLERSDGWRSYECVRRGAVGKVFSGRYRPVGKVFKAKPGSLESFLTERYCLYAAGRRGLHRAEIHHGPWPLQRAEAELKLTSIAPFELPGEPLCHFAPHQDALVWPLEPVAGDD